MQRSTFVSVVVPDLFGQTGGIARISRSLVLACEKFCAAHGLKIVVGVLNDAHCAQDHRYLSPGAEYRSFAGNRIELAEWVLAHARDPGHATTIFGHVNLATLGLLFPLQKGVRRYAIVTHGVEVWGPLPLHRRIALRCAHQVWPVSAYTARRVEDIHGVRPEAVAVIQNCLDPFWASPEGLPPSCSPDPFALIVSRMSQGDAYKGVDFAIQAFAEASPRRPSLQLLIAGDGADRPRLEQLSRSCGLESKVKFLGRVSDEELFGLYRDCQFFIMPSRKEGFGLVYLEAMAFAKAVIAADSGGAPEVVAAEATGLLVRYGDFDSLAKAIERLANPEEARRFGREGLRRLDCRFRFPRYEDEVAAALSKLVDPALAGDAGSAKERAA